MAIKRVVEPTEVKNLGHLRLWRDDLERVVEILIQVAPDAQMTVNSVYVIDSISDLPGIDEKEIKSFEFASSNPDLTLSLGPDIAVISFKSQRPEVRGAVSYAAEVAGNFWRARVSKIALIVVAVLLCLVAAITGVQIAMEGGSWPSWLSLALIVFLITALFRYTVWDILLGGSSAKISAQTRAEAPPWIKRNKDALTTNAAVSLVFLVIGFLLGKLTKS